MKIIACLCVLAILLYSVEIIAGHNKYKSSKDEKSRSSSKKSRHDDDSEDDSDEDEQSYVDWDDKPELSTDLSHITSSGKKQNTYAHLFDNDTSGYDFQDFSYWKEVQLLKKIEEILEKIEKGGACKRIKYGAIKFFNHLIKLLIEGKLAIKDWEYKDQMLFLKIELTIRKLFPSFMYKPEAYGRVEKVMIGIFNYLFSLTKEVEIDEVTKFITANMEKLVSKETIELERIQNAITKKKKKDKNKKVKHLYKNNSSIEEAYVVTTEVLDILDRMGFEWPLKLLKLVMEFDSEDIGSKTQMKTHTFVKVRRNLEALEWINAFKNLPDDSKDKLSTVLKSLQAFHKTDFSELDLPYETIFGMSKQLHKIKKLEKDPVFKADKNFNNSMSFSKVHLIKNMLNIILKCKKEYRKSKFYMKSNQKLKITNIWDLVLKHYTNKWELSLCKKFVTIGELYLRVDNIIETESKLARMVISSRVTGSKEDFFTTIAKEILETVSNKDTRKDRKAFEGAETEAGIFMNIKMRKHLAKFEKYKLIDDKRETAMNNYKEVLLYFGKYPKMSWSAMVQSQVIRVEAYLNDAKNITVSKSVLKLRKNNKELISSFGTGAQLQKQIDEMQSAVDLFEKARGDRSPSTMKTICDHVIRLKKTYEEFCSHLSKNEFKAEREEIESKVEDVIEEHKKYEQENKKSGKPRRLRSRRQEEEKKHKSRSSSRHSSDSGSKLDKKEKKRKRRS